MLSAPWTAQLASPIPSPLIPLHSLLLTLLNSMATTVNYLTTVLLPSSVLFLLLVSTHCDGMDPPVEETTTQPTTTPGPSTQKCYQCSMDSIKLTEGNPELGTATPITPGIDEAGHCPQLRVTCPAAGMQFNYGTMQTSNMMVLLRCNADLVWEYQPSRDQPKQLVTEISCKA